ncbi:hypothetical protein D3C87_1711630 [compost metagenome]
MKLDYGVIARLSDDPEGLITEGSFGLPPLVVGNLFVKMDVVGQHQNLFEMAILLSHLRK